MKKRTKKTRREAEKRAADALVRELRQLVNEFGFIPVLADLSEKFALNKGNKLERSVRRVAGTVIQAQARGVSLVGVGSRANRDG